jgi:dipeptidyl-peptidase-4
MKTLRVLALLLAACTRGAEAQATVQDEADAKFLRDLIETRYFSLGKPVNVRFLDDGSQVLFLRSAGPRKPDLGLYVFDVGTGKTRELLTPEQVLKGAAEKLSPQAVADWLDYDTCYTERYLGVPDRTKDTSTYDTNGLLLYAKDLTRPLLIIHGTADDNVHLSHSLRLADALLLAGKDFEFLPLAGETHSPRDHERLLRYYQRQFAFFKKYL